MTRLVAILCFLVVPFTYAADRDPHLDEKDCGAILSHSSFAHGYRHGYEEGFHFGNLDVNLARPQRTKWQQFKELHSQYLREFGSRSSFESGFKAGAMAGYIDGYRGTGFRVLEELRRIGAERFSPSPEFDKGIAAGYQDGFGEGGSSRRDIHVSRRADNPCSAHARIGKTTDPYCDGFQRGQALGKSDRIALAGSRDVLEASR